MDKDQSTETTARGTSDRSAALRRRVLGALREGDRRGGWHDALLLLDRADDLRHEADRQREIGLALLDKAGR